MTKKPEEKMTSRMHIVTTEADRVLLEQAAVLSGLTLSGFIKMCAVKRAREVLANTFQSFKETSP